MEILTGEQMRRVDRRAIDSMGLASLELMEAAGRGVAERLLRDFPERARHGVFILCGKGNNGGDGLVAARHLKSLGGYGQVLLFARLADLSRDAAVNHRRAIDAGVQVREVPDERAWADTRNLLARNVLVVDALLGTGVQGGARGLVAGVIDDVNASGAVVVSIDLPSGLNADTSKVEGPAIRARRTYTLCRPKVPLVFQPASRLAGQWSVIPIGIPDAAVSAERVEMEWLDAGAVDGVLARRAPDSHKGTFGHLLAIAGSRTKPGAAVLLARGALRSGAGLVTVATPASAHPLVACQQAEMMTEPLPETDDGGLAHDAASAASALVAGKDALAVGPGLGGAPETRWVVRELVANSPVPVVLDADGLNAFAEAGETATVLEAESREMVLTPHPGEAARLLGVDAREVQSDRRSAALRLAESTGAVVVLKGHRTVIAAPDGALAINSTGNAGMATAGTGDVLTGVIGAFLARGLTPWDSARLAVFAHGDAGDRAAAIGGVEGLVASDLVSRLPESLASLSTGPEDPR